MGVWNGTCALSHLPICRGDPTRLVLLLEPDVDENEPRAASFHTPSGLWAPYALPLLGQYDEYGGVRDIPFDWKAETALALLRTDVLEYDRPYQGFSAIRRSEFVGKDGLALTQQLIHEGRLVIRTKEHQDLRIGMCLVRDDIYRVLLGVDSSEGHTGATLASVTRVICQQLLDQRGWFDPTITPADYGLLAEDVWLHGRDATLKGWSSEAQAMLTVDVLTSRTLNPFGDRARALAMFRWAIVGLEGPAFEAGLADLAEFTYASILLGELRRFWSPQPGAGSQATSWYAHAVISKMVFDVSREAARKELGEEG